MKPAPFPEGGDDRNAHDNGFDTIRLLAAFAVLVSHAFALTGQAEPLAGTSRSMTLGTLAVGVFFVMSGYLITRSAERHGIGRYIGQRARRIMPALVVCVAVCAIAGLLVTALSPDAYLADPMLWSFIGNIAFLPRAALDLPGVFQTLPVTATNGSLWTLKFEIACYAFSLAWVHFGRARMPILIGLWVASFAASRWFAGDQSGVWFYLDRMAFLFRFYGAGMLLHALAHRVAFRPALGWAALTLVALSPLVGLFAEAAATLGAYAALTLAYRAPRAFGRITRRGDISYGVYLYAFPVQQLMVPLSLASAMPWLANIALSAPVVLMLGALSWFAVERPFLRRKDPLAAI